MATRLRAYCEEAGVPVTVVRIESQHVAKNLREVDILVPVATIGNSGKTVGGIVGILEPALQAVLRMMRQGGAVIFDWGGGLGAYRLETLAATALDQKLREAGVPAWSVVVTTPTDAAMSQALRGLGPIDIQDSPIGCCLIHEFPC